MSTIPVQSAAEYKLTFKVDLIADIVIKDLQEANGEVWSSAIADSLIKLNGTGAFKLEVKQDAGNTLTPEVLAALASAAAKSFTADLLGKSALLLQRRNYQISSGR